MKKKTTPKPTQSSDPGKVASFRNELADATSGIANQNIKMGAEFLAHKTSEEGVFKAESGLHYRITEEGGNERATAQDTVVVHYHGTLINGKIFDSSMDRGEPVTFPLNGVIPGFREGLQLVGKGGKITLYIPENLAYGRTPQPGSPIPPGATLVFEVEIIDIL